VKLPHNSPQIKSCLPNQQNMTAFQSVHLLHRAPRPELPATSQTSGNFAMHMQKPSNHTSRGDSLLRRPHAKCPKILFLVSQKARMSPRLSDTNLRVWRPLLRQEASCRCKLETLTRSSCSLATGKPLQHARGDGIPANPSNAKREA
jgi:hypothetical protein